MTDKLEHARFDETYAPSFAPIREGYLHAVSVFRLPSIPIQAGSLSSRFQRMACKDTVALPDVLEALAKIRDVVESHTPPTWMINAEWTSCLIPELNWGSRLCKVLNDRGWDELPSLEIELASGKVICERGMLSAVAILQCDRCIDAANKSEIERVAYLITDIQALLAEINERDIYEDLEVTRRQSMRQKSQAMNRNRHATRDDARQLVLEHWETDTTQFRSASKAGRYYADWLAKSGHEYEPNTVRDWIRARAKEIGIRFR